jgi:chorismate mutase
MIDLTEERELIDNLDRIITELLCRRFEAVSRIADKKARARVKTRNMSREEDVLESVRAVAEQSGATDPDDIETVYRAVMAAAVRMQNRRRNEI